MKEKEAILKRQKFNTRFKNEDMDFMFNWWVGVSQIIGMSPSQIFYALRDAKDGNPAGWRQGFRNQGRFQMAQAKEFTTQQQNLAAGQFYLGAAYAFRAALQFTLPKTEEFLDDFKQMEANFQLGVNLLEVPIKSIEIPFENTTLPGYFLEHDRQPRPVLIMIGGGDTFREDLFYFGGYPAWKRGYNAIMVDLPGQGITPDRNLHFNTDMDLSIKVIIGWLEEHALVKDGQIAIYGVSGGGFFSAQGVAADPRIKAWIAATPIFDIGLIFEREFGAALKAPGWLLNTYMGLAGAINESADINLKKYAWQFGTPDFKSAIDQVQVLAKPVSYKQINCPSLFLVSEGEAQELKRQTQEIYQNFCQRGVNVTLREFNAEQGADGHCQVNNLKLAHLILFNWLDQIFGVDSTDIRLYC